MDNIEATELVIRWIATKTALNVVTRNKNERLIGILSKQAADLQRQMRYESVSYSPLPPQHGADLFVRYRITNDGRQTDQGVLKSLLQTRVERIIRGAI